MSGAGGAVASLSGALEREEERLLTCVHCGFCLPACPTYVRLGDEGDSPRGRLYLMRAVAEGRLDPAADAFQMHIDRCLGCRACEPVCPSGVPYGHLLERARETAARARRPPLLARIVLASFATPRRTRWATGAARLLRATGLPALAARLLPSGGVAGRVRLAAAMLASTAAPDASASTEPAAAETSSPRAEPAPEGPERAVTPPESREWAMPNLETTEPPAPTGESSERSATPVAFLTGCVQEGLYGRVNRATERTLEANGYRVVDSPGQGCCGALHAHSGDLEGARALARRNVDAFEAAGIEGIVVNAAGCGAVMKEYGSLLEDDPEYGDRARRLAESVMDVSEALADRGPRPGGALPVRVTYDAPCHLLHAQLVEEPPLRVLRAIPGLELLPLPGSEECCGGAGLYGVTHPELGGRIGRDKVEAVLSTGADVVATGNPGCMMQIGAGLRMAGARTDVRHPVELLDESYRRGGVYDGRGVG